MSQSPSPNLSAGRSFQKEGGGKRTKKSWEGGCKVLYVQTSIVHSNKACDGPACVIPVQSSQLSHPSFRSSQLHTILTPRLKGSKSPGAGVPESWGSYILKLVPRILI